MSEEKVQSDRLTAIDDAMETIRQIMKFTEKVNRQISIVEEPHRIIVYVNIEGYIKNETLKIVTEFAHIADKEALVHVKEYSVEFEIKVPKGDI